ncbi:MAG: thiamine phosphate synthase [Muribaculaceae bacterium]|nr:thiamine phosphate synthase [Muribaculaceae bacterium]
MNKEFLIVAITRPDFFEGESGKISQILENNEAMYVHIRKPEATINEIEKLLREIPCHLHDRLKLHDGFELCEKYNIGGIHLNSRNSTIPRKNLRLSKSIHSIEELGNCKNIDYCFLSPIFDSISKKGYLGRFDLNEISDKILGKKVVALGGVTPDKFDILRNHNFYGAALLSHFFPTE